MTTIRETAPGATVRAAQARPAAFDASRDFTRPLVSAVMPCLNEARTIGICIEKAQRCFAALGVAGEVVVADNGSVDGSVEIARQLGARVIHQPVRGYGAALQAGIEAARGEIIVMGDSDDSYDWSTLGPFIDKIREGYDLVMGNRFRGGIEKGAMPPLHRYLGNPVLSFVSRVAFGVPVGDFHCGMRAFTRRAYDRMAADTTGMEFATEIVAGAARSGLRIGEIPIRLYPDKRGRPPHLRSFRDGWRHLRFIVSYAPDHLYLWPGSAMLLLGLLLQALLAPGPVHAGGLYMGIHFLALGGLLSILGLNLLLMGVLGKLVVRARYPGYATPFVERFGRHFRLERGLLLGLAVFAAGFTADAAILWQWLRTPGISMEHTIHPAFVATNAMALGANLAFGSFLVHLIFSMTLVTQASGAAHGTATEAVAS